MNHIYSKVHRERNNELNSNRTCIDSSIVTQHCLEALLAFGFLKDSECFLSHEITSLSHAWQGAVRQVYSLRFTGLHSKYQVMFFACENKVIQNENTV